MASEPGRDRAASREGARSRSATRGETQPAATALEATAGRDEPRAESAGADAETISAPGTAVASILATVAGILVLAVGVGVVGPAVVATVTGCLLTATVTATKRRTPGGRAVGSVLVILAAVGMVAAVGLVASGTGESATAGYRLGVVVAIALAAFGATATVTGAIGDGAVRSAPPVAVFTAIPIAATAMLYTDPVRSMLLEGVVGGATSRAGVVVDRLLAPDGAVGGVVSFVALLVGLLWLAAVVLTRLPIPELLPRDRRETARQRIESVATRAKVSGVFLLLAGGLALVVAAADDAVGIPYLEDIYSPLESAIVSLTTAGWLRVGFLFGIAALIALFAASKLPGLYRLRYTVLATWGPVVTGGVLASLLVIVAYPPIFERFVRPPLETALAENEPFGTPVSGELLPPQQLLSTLEPPSGTAVAALATTTVVGTIVTVLLAVSLIGAIRLLPRRAAPGAFGASALVGGSIVAAMDGVGALLVSLPVVCAIVSWDAAVYGVSITEELGRETAVRLPAVAHSTGTAVVGVISVALALGLGTLLESITVRTGITIGLSLTVALLLVVVALKRRAIRSQPASRPVEPSTDAVDSPEDDGTNR